MNMMNVLNMEMMATVIFAALLAGTVKAILSVISQPPLSAMRDKR